MYLVVYRVNMSVLNQAMERKKMTNEIKTVNELKKGDILNNTKHGFDIEIVEIGKKNTRYINLETGEKVKSITSKFNFMLRQGVFTKV